MLYQMFPHFIDLLCGKLSFGCFFSGYMTMWEAAVILAAFTPLAIKILDKVMTEEEVRYM